MVELLSEREWQARHWLREHWNAFCDADIIPVDRDEFTERLEEFDLIHFRKVRKVDLDISFAAERGIEMGGYLWELSSKGRSVLEAASLEHAEKSE